MEEIDIRKLEQIPVPEGLEQRLSVKIDEWEKAEQAAKADRRRSYSRLAVAASIAVAATIGLTFAIQSPAPASDSAKVDTYTDPRLAYEETVRALNLLAHNIERCQQQLDRVDEIRDNNRQIINRNLNIKE